MDNIDDILAKTVAVTPEVPPSMEEAGILATITRVAHNMDNMILMIQDLATRTHILEQVVNTILIVKPDICEQVAALINEAQESLDNRQKQETADKHPVEVQDEAAESRIQDTQKEVTILIKEVQDSFNKMQDEIANKPTQDASNEIQI